MRTSLRPWLVATLVPALVAVAVVACTPSTDEPQSVASTPPPSPSAEPAPTPPTPSLPCDPAFTAWQAAGFSGSVTIASHSRIECTAGYGLADRRAGTPNTSETVFAIGSVTKAFTAAAVVDLVDHGILSLDDRAGDLVPDLSGPAADATVGQLLVHTSGGSPGRTATTTSRSAAGRRCGR